MSRVWKSLDKYCLLETNTTGTRDSDRIIEISCLKVIDNSVVDKYQTFINPNYPRCYKKFSEYNSYNIYPTVQEAVPKLLEFAKGFYFVGWCIDFDLYHLEKEGKFEYNKNVVDVFESYYRTHRDHVVSCSLENIYEYITKGKKDVATYNFEDPYERALALKYAYDYKKDLNKFIYKEMPRYDYLDFGNDKILWLKGEKQGKLGNISEVEGK